MDSSTIKDSYELIKKSLPVEANFDDRLDPSFDRLLDWLTLQLQVLLNTDFGGLLNALYRIDVSEEQVRAILEVEDPDEMARSLAELVLRRQIQKVETRRRYSGQ